jgi:hypothetical protein
MWDSSAQKNTEYRIISILTDPLRVKSSYGNWAIDIIVSIPCFNGEISNQKQTLYFFKKANAQECIRYLKEQMLKTETLKGE